MPQERSNLSFVCTLLVTHPHHADYLKPIILEAFLMRRNMARVQTIFEYDNDHPGGIPPDGAVNYIWRKILLALCRSAS
ncbi:hypothetical protein LIER_33540 [Lithospermum erythrorhizon]|uniref:Uncharacterized protein n=1 Tax=Lithospermum erythrorhizon TaxID=34254 RepID=A0AAV3S132_LITER